MLWLLYPGWKKETAATQQKAGWAPEPVWKIAEKKIHLPIPEIQPPNFPASRLVTVPTILLQF